MKDPQKNTLEENVDLLLLQLKILSAQIEKRQKRRTVYLLIILAVLITLYSALVIYIVHRY